MADISGTFKEHYRETVKKFGASAKGVDWKNSTQADIRHKVMLDIIRNRGKKVSVLDVGCGYGEQLNYAKKNNIDIEYTGIDLVPEMISLAKKTHKGANFVCADIINFKPHKKFDYITCNGVFTQKLRFTDSEMLNYMNLLISKMLNLANDGIAFNALTTKVDYMKKGNFYLNPFEALSIAFMHSNIVQLDHSYPLFEYTIYIYKS